MKILHSADWHLDAPMTGKNEEQARFLRQELRKVPEKVAALAKQEQCDLMLLAGDLFDGEYTQDSFREVYNALKDAEIPVLLRREITTSASPVPRICGKSGRKMYIFSPTR